MTDAPIPEILVLDADEAQGRRVVQILEDQGWKITYETTSEKALARLEAAGKKPFHLFVSNYKLPKMEGDDILKTVRTLSPLTQRMLMVPSNEADLVIRAINKAEINACIVTPASDRDLLDRVTACLNRFRQTMKREQLKRVTVHQNRQMFQIARRLKKKDQWCQDQISEKKAEKLLLRSSLRKAARAEDVPETLSGRIERYNISLDSQTLETEFFKLADYTRALFCSAAVKARLEKPGEDMPPLTGHGSSPPVQVDPDRDKQVASLLKIIFASPENAEFKADCQEEDDCVEELLLANFVRVTTSKDQTRAFVQLTDPVATPELLTVSGILEMLRQNDISYGIETDKDISAWITSVTPEDEPFPVALGEPAVPGKDGTVDYHFEIDYTNPGKLMEDGRIDFRDRGEIPFVNPGDLLAVKTPPKEGKDGMSVSGVSIFVEPPFDPVFLAGNGTKLSEDGLSVHAIISGQPHLDPFGEISVNPELPINGNVDFETGNVNFNGNILVRGTVKDGFQVKGINLIAAEIEGGVIDASGDLYISDGITDATILCRGSIYAKFINNSKVTAFGDLVIQKEIIDSNILLSGTCENPNGMILSSQITAKGGVEAGNIGTDTSKPSRFRVGVDDHLNAQTDEIENRLEKSVKKLKAVREDIRQVEENDQELYGRITEKAQAQEAAQNQFRKLKNRITELRHAGDKEKYMKAVQAYRAQAKVAEKAEHELDRIFEIQDHYAEDIERLKRRIRRIEETNKTLVLKKRGLREFGEKSHASPTIIVNGSINADEVIFAPNASLTMPERRSRCKITEQTRTEYGLHFSEMVISDL